MKEKLLILGAGGHGQCAFEIAEELGYDPKFLDDDISKDNVIGTIDELSLFANEYSMVFVAIGNIQLRKKFMNEVEALGYELVSLIHPHSFVSKKSKIGKGSIVFPFACIEANSQLGDGCILCSNSVIQHDVQVDDLLFDLLQYQHSFSSACRK